MQHRTSLFENGMIWCGAGISIAEILTGTYLAPLGMTKGIIAIILGHLIGCSLLFLSGVIGGQLRISAMESVKLSFGQIGALFFALLNVLQLVGWTGIMIYDGSLAADGLWQLGQPTWCLLIGILIILWLVIGIRRLKWLNLVALAALLLLTVGLCYLIFTEPHVNSRLGSLSFGQGLELAISMPLSWLPLISDYTSVAQKPAQASGVSAVMYGVISCWMAIVGLGATLLTGETNIAKIMLGAGVGLSGLAIVLLSTVTTTFMDAYSAGVSAQTLKVKWSSRSTGILVTVFGVLGAIILPMDNFSNFLYIIGSVFTPMITIQIMDRFVFHFDNRNQQVNWRNFNLWLIGFIVYRCLMLIDLPVGNTLPDVMIVMLLVWLVERKRKSTTELL
ncbi:putative hydroxymethylpyrimidine transporter CytX [Limosilactobacillus sp. Sa3CUN2]|uniref:Hydroxymethylpyrimidine transporter CytX n=1 Tax=Limosilactobacillus avistercoris TaxID=2762243 RepID=A0ABR8PAM5_9LACO|nr:putative hydroxymethylpyrimidine transporter CytX [Limosilactobacillus avistercoris]MBD7894350.1 putative hydroxymethylpyrimidine transporter CytX [Limosilactobacillus avistercoris]